MRYSELAKSLVGLRGSYWMRVFSAKRILVLLSILTLGASSIAPLSLHAQENEREGVGISPTKLTLDADPGETLDGTFIVTNPGTSSIKYHVYVKDFTIRNEDYEKDFEPLKDTISPVEWITVPSGVSSLNPGEQKKLKYSMAVPADAVPRGYYAVIFAETVEPEAETTGVARLKRVGSLVYLTVKGGSVEKGSVASFDVDTWQSNRPVKATLRIQNEGNVHFAAEGSLRLKDVFGRVVSQTNATGTILPATVRKFKPELKLGMPFGLYKVEGEAVFLGKTTPLESKWVVVGSPFWLILWAVVIIGWAIVLIRWVKRRAKHKKQK